jgi:hypothetical protein
VDEPKLPCSWLQMIPHSSSIALITPPASRTLSYHLDLPIVKLLLSLSTANVSYPSKGRRSIEDDI